MGLFRVWSLPNTKFLGKIWAPDITESLWATLYQSLWSQFGFGPSGFIVYVRQDFADNNRQYPGNLKSSVLPINSYPLLAQQLIVVVPKDIMSLQWFCQK